MPKKKNPSLKDVNPSLFEKREKEKKRAKSIELHRKRNLEQTATPKAESREQILLDTTNPDLRVIAIKFTNQYGPDRTEKDDELTKSIGKMAKKELVEFILAREAEEK